MLQEPLTNTFVNVLRRRTLTRRSEFQQLPKRAECKPKASTHRVLVCTSDLLFNESSRPSSLMILLRPLITIMIYTANSQRVAKCLQQLINPRPPKWSFVVLALEAWIFLCSALSDVFRACYRRVQYDMLNMVGFLLDTALKLLNSTLSKVFPTIVTLSSRASWQSLGCFISNEAIGAG